MYLPSSSIASLKRYVLSFHDISSANKTFSNPFFSLLSSFESAKTLKNNLCKFHPVKKIQPILQPIFHKFVEVPFGARQLILWASPYESNSIQFLPCLIYDYHSFHF